MRRQNTDGFRFDFEKMDAYVVAQEVVAGVVRLSATWPRGWADLRDQAKRAATSSLLNLAEGVCQAQGSGRKRRHYEDAFASAGEVAAALKAAATLGLSPRESVTLVQRDVARLGAMLAGLIRSAKR